MTKHRFYIKKWSRHIDKTAYLDISLLQVVFHLGRNEMYISGGAYH